MNALQGLLEILRDRRLTVSFAESCTGGLLSSRLTEIPGVSDVFQGAVISYSNRVKQELLEVNSGDLQQQGAVSEIVARQMSEGARRRLHSDWSVAITGVAGPGGGSSTKPVGFVWFAASGPSGTVSVSRQFEGTRVQIQSLAAEFACEWLISAIKGETSI